MFYPKQSTKRLSSFTRRNCHFERLEDRRVLATIVVTSLADGPLDQLAGDGLISLREALEAANANRSVDGSPAGARPVLGQITDQILFGVSGRIVLTAGELEIREDVSIAGTGADSLTIDAAGNSRIFNGFSGRGSWISISDLHLTGGNATAENSNGMGGGIYSNALLILSRVIMSDNTAEIDGGAINNFGNLQLINTTVVNNQAQRGGGTFTFGTLETVNSTITGNTAARGAGTYVSGDTTGIYRSSTIAGNMASEVGGGIYQTSNFQATNSLIVGNHTVDGVDSDVTGVNRVYSGGYNLFGRGVNAGLANAGERNTIGVDWKTVLENDGSKPILRNNGGPTPTIAILRDGPAQDAGDPQYAGLAVDQRGFARVVDNDNDGTAVIDVGAIELDSNLRLQVKANSVSENGAVLTYTVSISRKPATGSLVSVDFAIAPSGTATVGKDFNAVTQTVTFDSAGPLSKTILVPVLEDPIVEDQETVVVTLSNPNGGVIETSYRTATGTIIDNDRPGLAFNKNSVTVSEDGSRVDSVAVVLTAPPSQNVILAVDRFFNGSHFMEAQRDKLSLVYTPENWNVPQEINLWGIDDLVDDGDKEGVLAVRVFFATYDAYEVASPISLPIFSIDDDTRGIRVSEISGDTSESGRTAIFSVVLDSAPSFSIPVIVPLASSDETEGTVSLRSLTFTKDNWNVPQTVTVTGKDDEVSDGDVRYSIILGPAVSRDVNESDYHGLDPADISLTNIDNDTPVLDFGDAPTAVQSGLIGSYPTTLALDGARHLVTDLYLGKLVDTEADGVPEANAGSVSGGDDGNALADEDGITSIATLVSSATASTVSSVSVFVHGIGKLDAWIDFNQDGDWNDNGEQISASRAVTDGINLLSFTIPAGAKVGKSFARFRLSTSGGLAPTGAAADGEVEDFAFNVISSAPGITAYVTALTAGTLEVSAVGTDVIVSRGTQQLFRAPVSGLSLQLLGSPGDDEFVYAANGAVRVSDIVTVDGAGGRDTIRLMGDGTNLNLTGTRSSRLRSIENIDVRGNGVNTLQLNVDAIQNLGAGLAVRVRHDVDDIVGYAGSWSIQQPKIASASFLHVLTAGPSTVEVQAETPYKNSLNPFDVNGDGFVSPLDALMVINALNIPGNQALTTPTTVPAEPFEYLDTSGDNFVSPIDALLVINAINMHGPEGEEALSAIEISHLDTSAKLEHPSDWAASIDLLAEERKRRAW